MLNTKFESARYTATETFTEQNKIEACLNLADTNFDSILSVSGEVSPGFIEAKNGEIDYGGRVTFNAIYKQDGFERVEAGAEFSYKKYGAFDGGKANASYTLLDVKLKRSGGMLYVEAVLNTTIYYERPKEITFVSDIEALKKPMMVSGCFDVDKSQTFELDDEFECSKIKKVLHSSAVAYVNQVECSYGAVRFMGEVVLSLSLLPFLQNNDIVKEKRVIPFNLEVECDNVEPGMSAIGFADVLRLALKVYVDEEATVSTISSIVEIMLSFKAQKAVEYNAVDDVYSCTCELNATREKCEYDWIVGLGSQTEKAFGKMICDVPENSRFISAVAEGVESLNYSVIDSEKRVDLIVGCDAVFVDGEGEFVSRKAEFPLSVVLEGDCDISRLKAVVTGISPKLRNGQIEAEIAVKISFAKLIRKSVETIKEVWEGEDKPLNNATISVYLAKNGDTEWDVTKELGVDIDSIFELNPTLEFPLKGGERVICFRQKRI